MTPSTLVSAARELRSSLRGSVLVTTDAGYDDARRIWNGAVDHHPAVIVRCETDQDVVTAVRAAREHDLPLSVRGGGHDWGGRSLRADGLVIDLSLMRGVTVTGGTAQVQGGATAGNLVAAAHQHGSRAVTGTVNAVGMAGLTLAGGYGPLGGRHGLALDNLVGARVVLADGRHVSANAFDNPDLFWALRGGGGNFGVVTTSHYRVHPGASVLSGLLLFPMAQARTVLRGYRELLADAPDELTVMAGFFAGPDGQPLLFLLPTWSGEHGAGEPFVTRLHGLGTPVAGQVGPMDYQDILAMFDGTIVNGRHNEMRTRWLPELTDDTMAAVVAAAAAMTSPFSGLFLHHFHGAAARVPAGDTAFALRSDHLLVEIVAAWQPSEDDTGVTHRSWARGLSDDLAPHALPGGYPNLLGPDEGDRALLAYGANGARLLDIKRRFDPDRVFSALPDLNAAAF